MNRKQIIIAVIVGVLLFIGLLFYLLRDRNGPTEEVGEGELPRRERVAGTEGFWPDAPPPETDPEELRRLWPDLFLPAPDREEAEREWKAFAKLYPNNVYIPSRYTSAPDDAEKERRLKTLDTVGDVETKLAVRRMQLEKGARPGTDGPDAPADSDISPEDQRIYFGYRIRELESRIQLVEYFLNQGNADAQQRALASDDLNAWKKELAEYKRIVEEIPR